MATLYCKDECKYCHLAKGFLKENEVPFTVVELDPKSDDYATQRDALIERSGGHKTFPWVFVKDETFIGGYNELVHAYNTQRLHTLLRAVGVEVPEPDF